MTKGKQWIALGAAAVLAVLAAGWFLLIAPKRAEATDRHVQQDAVVAKTAELSTQLSVLKAQAKNVAKEQAKIDEVAAQIPPAPEMPDLVRALSSTATKSGVELLTITPAAPTALAAPVAAAHAPAASATTDSTVTPKPAATAAPAGGVGTLNQMPVTMSVVGGYYQIEQFVAALESLPRALKISGLTLAPGTNPVALPANAAASVTDGSMIAAAITGQVYLAVGRTEVPAIVVPGVKTPTVPAK